MLPRLTYGIEIWFGAPQYSLNRIQVRHKNQNDIHIICHTTLILEVTFFLTIYSKVYDLGRLVLGSQMFNLTNNVKFAIKFDFHNYRSRNKNKAKIPKFHRKKKSNHAEFIGI